MHLFSKALVIIFRVALWCTSSICAIQKGLHTPPPTTNKCDKSNNGTNQKLKQGKGEKIKRHKGVGTTDMKEEEKTKEKSGINIYPTSNIAENNVLQPNYSSLTI